VFIEPDEAATPAGDGTGELDPGCDGPGNICVEPVPFEQYLASQKIGYTVVPLGWFVAVVPDRPVSATAVREAFKITS